MKEPSTNTRRQFLVTATGTGLLLAGCTSLQKHESGGEEAEKVTPGEDLMQEHGVLKRILLVYGEGIRRMNNPTPAGSPDLSPDAIQKAARLVRSFVEDYHERQEEQFLFPRLKAAGKEVATVDILLAQHQAGRRVTDLIITLATTAGLRDAGQRGRLVDAMQQFIRMYEVHEAREDTVVFPAFRDLVSKQEYEDLGEKFEDNEHKHFGADGFEMAVDQIAEVEKSLGIYDLAQFTPKA
ncbi:MAG TPA: hemerythrin domain-containing protein [Phycisphaerae bacterium]|nr:hemerythrin domain-containing protein [Phycisphaerae bacterium]